MISLSSRSERLIEDHEIIHTVTTNWAPDSNNILVMSERITKYDLFNEPADYLPIEMFDTTTSNLCDMPRNVRRSSLLRVTIYTLPYSNLSRHCNLFSSKDIMISGRIEVRNISKNVRF